MNLTPKNKLYSKSALQPSERNYELESDGNLNRAQLDDIAVGSEVFLKSNTRPMLSFIMDDGRDLLHDNYTDVFEPNNIPLCVAMPIFLYSDPLSISKLNDIVEGGGEILSHGYSSVTLQSTDTETDNTEIVFSLERLKMYGLQCGGFVPAQGVIDEEKVAKVSRHYSYGFCNYAQDLVDTSKDFYHLNRVNMADNLILVKSKIDEVVENNGWLVLYAHGVGSDDGMVSESDIAEIITYANAYNIDYVNIFDGLTSYGNLVTKKSYKRASLNTTNIKYGENKIDNPLYQTFGLTSNTTPIGWTLDASNMSTGTLSQSVSSSNSQGYYRVDFNEDNAVGDYFELYQELFIGSIQKETAITISAPIDIVGTVQANITVEWWNDDGLLATMIDKTFSGEGKKIVFESFSAIESNSKAFLKINFKIITSNANTSDYVIFRNMTLKILNTPTIESDNSTKDFVYAYNNSNQALNASSGVFDTVIWDRYTYKNLDFDASAYTFTARKNGLYEIEIELIVSGSFTGNFRLYSKSNNGMATYKKYALDMSAEIQTLRFKNSIELKRGESYYNEIWKDASSTLTIIEDSTILIKQIS